MLISFYMLKETAELLCTDMLSILEGANVSELFFEDSDVSKRRKHLQSRLGRLTAAHEELVILFERSEDVILHNAAYLTA